ncbi:hypothetical protein GCM10023340_00240 [Nocardioides marinquilinus]|uniref:Alkaline phosphatase family protein n=1 Tax=Nocardioides marinquilinus TaxID=1210400 RepID=A0ABP9P415_9ACTN
MTRRAVALVAAGVLALAGCSGGDDGAGPAEPSSGAPDRTAATSAPATPERTGPTRPTEPTEPAEPTDPANPTRSPDPAEPADIEHVVAISVDGLTPDVLDVLGPDEVPALRRLLREGAGTLNARTELESTQTLPNHVGMVTGRPVDPAAGGHGVDWNDDRLRGTVQVAAGGPVASLFSVVDEAGGSSAVFTGKVKLGIFALSWPDAVDRSVVEPDTERLARLATRDLARRQPTVTFVHLAGPDEAGHAAGWLSPAYLDAVREADRVIGRLLRVVGDVPALRDRTAVVLTADHGGSGSRHRDPADPVNYTIPFVVAGPGVPAGDLYELSPGLADPGRGRPGYDAARPPVRSCDLADVALTLLRLPPVPDAGCDAAALMPLTTG